MIARQARVLEVVRRAREDGTVSYSATVAIDESAATTVRLSAEDHNAFERALFDKKRFVMTLGIAAPSLVELASRDAAGGAT